MIVELTPLELAMCTFIAEFQRNKSIRDGRRHNMSVNRTPEQHLAQEIMGRKCEMAVAKKLGVYPEVRLDTFSTYPDVSRFDVRSVSSPTHRLIHRDNDKIDRPFILGVVSESTVHIVGWLWGHEARRDRYLGNPGGTRLAWWVPIIDLRQLTQLREFGGDA